MIDIDKDKIKIIMIIVIEILCLFIVFYTLLYFQYKYTAEIEQKYSRINILYTKETEVVNNKAHQNIINFILGV